MLRKKQSPSVEIPLDPHQRWLLVSEAAIYLNVSTTTIRALIHRGEIPAARLQPGAGGFHLDRNDLDRWMERRKRIIAPYKIGSRPWVRDSKPWRERKDRKKRSRRAAS